MKEGVKGRGRREGRKGVRREGRRREGMKEGGREEGKEGVIRSNVLQPKLPIW